MTEQTPVPSPNLGDDRKAARHRDGRLLIGSGVTNLLLVLVVAVLATVVVQQSGAIGRLSGALTGQRDQFTACKNQPATAPGCTQPVAAEPAVIVKEGQRGLAGAVGAPGSQGPMGPQGPVGPAGPPGAVGKTGPPPGCALLSTACIGTTGAAGTAGKDGADGKDGINGVDGKDGAPGKDGEPGQQGGQGEMGTQGPPGVGIDSTQCVNDDTATGSHWLVTYKDGAQETSAGPCRIKLP